MADEQVIIDVKIDAGEAAKKLGELNSTISTLEASQKELKKAIKEGNDEFGANSRAVAENDKALKALKAEAKSLTGQLQMQTKEASEAGDSFVEMAARTAQLEKEYKSLTKAQRESAQGKEIKKALIEQKKALQDFDAELGNHQRNVGNYPQIMGGVFGQAQKIVDAFSKKGQGSIKDFAKTLLTTPIGWLLAGVKLLMVAFDKLVSAFKKNDDAATNMSRLYATVLQPVINAINKAFSFLADIIGKVAGKLADLIGSASESARAAQDLVVATDQLEDAEREYAKNKAERDADIAEKREKALDAEEYSIAQRKKFLEEAQKLEDKNFEEGEKIALERLRLEKERNKQAQDTSDAAKNRENELQIALDKLRQDNANSQRALTRQLKSLDNELTQDAKAKAKERADALKEEQKERERIAKEDEEAQRRRNQNTLDVQKQLQDAMIALMADGADKEAAQTTLQYEREIEALRAKYAEEGALTEEGEQALLELVEAKREEMYQAVTAIYERDREANKKVNDEKKEADKIAAAEAKKVAKDRALQTVQATVSIMDSLNSMIDAFEDDDEKRAKASQAIAIGKALVNSGVAISEGVAAAAGVPFPGNIAAIVSTVASVAANIATAVSTIKQAKFATGGIVGGTSYTGDNVPVRVNSGEMILNREQQAQLFDIANGGLYSSSLEGLTGALVTAMAAQPAPVMVYSEYNDFKAKVATYNDNAKL